MSSINALNVLCLLLLFCRFAAAFWTVDCSILTRERTDPIVAFGKPSSHLHLVAGSSKFSQTSTNDILRQSNCTTCDVKQDLSAYWTPLLFVAPPQLVGGDQDSLINGGAIPVPSTIGSSFIVYYKLITKIGERSNNNLNQWETIKPFPPNFRMLVSESVILNKTATTSNIADRPVGYRCLGFGNQEFTANFPADPSLCTIGLRAELTFPSCWNGVDSDSADHTSHVAYPIGSWAGSACPPTHPVRLPTLMFENIYDTKQVKDKLAAGWKLTYPRMPNQFTTAGTVQ